MVYLKIPFIPVAFKIMVVKQQILRFDVSYDSILSFWAVVVKGCPQLVI